MSTVALTPHRLLGATIVALDCRSAPGDRPFGADVLDELASQGLLGQVLWSTACEVGQVDVRAFRALAAGGLIEVRLDLGAPTGPDELRAAMEAVHTLYHLRILVEYDFDLFGPAPRFAGVLGRASFLRAIVSDGSTPATFRLPAGTGSPWLSAYQRRLVPAVAPWLGDGGLAGRLRDAWAELTVAERLLRGVTGVAAHRIALQRLTMRSNTALLALVTDSARDFERDGDSDRLEPALVSARLADLETVLRELRDSFLSSNAAALVGGGRDTLARRVFTGTPGECEDPFQSLPTRKLLPMRRTRLIALVLVVLGVISGGVLTAVPAAADPPEFDHLDPGGQPRLVERLPVNVVFIGYDQSQLNPAAFFGALPRSYEPVVRRRLDYGVKEPLGITYTYDYQVRFTDKAYQDKFFRQLKKLATKAPLTTFQSDYNDQQANAKVVADNHHIDAPSVEKWLAYNPPGGVDTRRNTVFLINWHGRSDFVHHVYTKTDEPDPDTGYNFGVERASRKLVAWGGTTANDEENGLGSTRRVWFHDLSAGPESWAGNWNVDDADLDGDGEADYRIPVAWEYGAYRPKAKLTGDLAKLVRYVALDLLFTTSPLYPVELPTKEPPATIDIDQNTYEGWPGVDASKTYLKPPLIKAELSELVWRNRLSYDDQDLPFRGHAERCYEQAMEGVSCYPQLGYPAEANFFLQNTFQLGRTQDDQGRVDYELPVFNYAVGAGVPTPALGFADDNYRDGTQSYVFGFVSPEIVEAGYGLTTTTIHEVGHHLGMSHPHDGYDSTSGVDFGPSGAYYFVNAGDESNSMMSYIDLNWDFSQFDRDNMDRFQTAALNEAANRLAELALAAPQAQKAYDELQRADHLLGQAKRSFARHDYIGAMSSALQAYESVVEGAREAGVDVDAAQTTARIAARESRRPSSAHPPHEFIDTLQPNGPRSQP